MSDSSRFNILNLLLVISLDNSVKYSAIYLFPAFLRKRNCSSTIIHDNLLYTYCSQTLHDCSGYAALAYTGFTYHAFVADK